jgi:hypothetical protein
LGFAISYLCENELCDIYGESLPASVNRAEKSCRLKAKSGFVIPMRTTPIAKGGVLLWSQTPAPIHLHTNKVHARSTDKFFNLAALQISDLGRWFNNTFCSLGSRAFNEKMQVMGLMKHE